MHGKKKQAKKERDYAKWQRDKGAEDAQKSGHRWKHAKGSTRDKVRLSSIGKAGEIISFSDDGMQLTVQCGVFRSKVSFTEVESLDGQKAEINPLVEVRTSQVRKNLSLVRTKKNTLDVRGLRVHEAEGLI